jgi:superfamily I DNA and/or RNA helicase
MGVNVNTTASAPVGNDTSPRNMGEVDFITEFLHDLFSFMPKRPATRPLAALDILVETPYSSQRTALREALKDPKLHPQCRLVDVCSLAGVQGREAGVVIFSMVQNNEEAHNVGILKVGRNLNVASTRAKKLSVTVGSFELFLQSIANRDKKFFQGNFDKFRSFIEDFQVKNDIIRDTDLVKALDPANSTVLVRDESDWPREFRMTDEARIKLYGVKKTGKQDEDV